MFYQKKEIARLYGLLSILSYDMSLINTKVYFMGQKFEEVMTNIDSRVLHLIFL